MAHIGNGSGLLPLYEGICCTCLIKLNKRGEVMKQNLNSETHFHPVVATKRQSGRSNGCAKSLAELAGMCTPEEVLPSKASAVLLPRYLTERANAVNFAFANFLLG